MFIYWLLCPEPMMLMMVVQMEDFDLYIQRVLLCSDSAAQ